MKITIDNVPPEKIDVIVHLLNDILSNVSAESKVEIDKCDIPVVFDNVRSTAERISNRKRQCFGTSKNIEKGEKYINHQFRYDGRIITISFSISYFNGC